MCNSRDMSVKNQGHKRPELVNLKANAYCCWVLILFLMVCLTIWFILKGLKYKTMICYVENTTKKEISLKRTCT